VGACFLKENKMPYIKQEDRARVEGLMEDIVYEDQLVINYSAFDAEGVDDVIKQVVQILEDHGLEVKRIKL
jgi:ribosomal protein S10